MQPRAPMLLIVRNWHRSQYHYVEGWATPYVPTIKMLCSLISNNVITKDTIDLDANVWCIVLLMLYDNVIKEDTMYFDDDIWSIALLLSFDDLDITFILNIDGSA